jgi:hypothetical protein
VNPKLPTDLESIIGKAMEKDRSRRYQSAQELKADLRRLKIVAESGLAKTGPQDSGLRSSISRTFRSSSPLHTYLLLGPARRGWAPGDGSSGGGSLVVQASRGRRNSGQNQEYDRGAAAAKHQQRFQH